MSQTKLHTSRGLLTYKHFRASYTSQIWRVLSAIYWDIERKTKWLRKNKINSGTGLGYGMDDRGSGFDSRQGAGNFPVHHRVQTGSGAHPASYLVGTRGSFPGDKAAGAWSWPLTSIYCRGQEWVEVYLQIAIRLHDVVLRSTGVTLHLTYLLNIATLFRNLWNCLKGRDS
jgi:hypothetical protein